MKSVILQKNPDLVRSAIVQLRLIVTKWPGKILLWISLLSLGLLLLYGRYDWLLNPLHARIGFVCSAYYFLIVTPVLFYLVQEFTENSWFAFAVTGIWFFVATLPYHWLNLEKFFYPLETLYPQKDFLANLKPLVSGPDWFPQAFRSLPAIPHEGVIFSVLAIMGIGIAVLLVFREHRLKKTVGLVLLAYAIVLIETWLHLSHRSPYLYYTLFDTDPSANRWFIAYMFPNGKGAVNLDMAVFRAVELLFMGKPYISDMLFRRSVYFYFSSQISYFFNLYYVALVFNIFLWIAAVVCGYLFTRKYWSERVARLTAGLIATGPGFIMFVAQPMNYLAGYAVIMILIYLFERLVIEQAHKIHKSFLFASILGLASLNYDLFPFYVFIFGYGLSQKVDWKRLLGISTVAIILYSGALLVYTRGLGIQIATSNSQFATGTLYGVYQFIKTATADLWYIKFREYFGQFFLNIGSVFLVLPVVFALLGLPLLKGRIQRLFILYIFLPALLLQAVLQFGNSIIYQLPRLYFMVYPGVYILAALFLDSVSQALPASRLARLAPALPWIGLALIIVLNNIDVWGIPSLYYHLYWSAPQNTFLLK